MIDIFSNCYFHNDGYCLLSDDSCGKVCKNAVKKYPELSFKDHYDIYNKRKEQKMDLLIRWLPILISVGALLISLWKKQASL